MNHGTKPGTLILVATPIGNLEDVTSRALRALKEADILAVEDTRRTRKLLSRYEISKKMTSYYEHNEERRIPGLLNALQEGKDVALVSDAGSPGISDPGYRLVKKAVEHGIPVTAVPGPSALILALSLSGLPTDRFTFYGFLPRGREQQRRLLEEASRIPHTLLFFESPHRVVKSLEQMLHVLGDRQTALCRELTKRFEQILRGSLSELVEKTREKEPRGEYCIVVAGREVIETSIEDREEALCLALEDVQRAEGEPLKGAARKAAIKYGLSRREVYQEALRAAREKREG